MATPIGLTDQNDCDLRCLIDRLSGRRPLISPFDAIGPPGSDERNGPQRTTTPAPESNYLSILLPVFLVIGVIVLVLVVFMLHRFISLLLKKRLRSSRHRRNNEGGSGQGDANEPSNGLDDNPPSYRQMMGSVENGDMPPSYYEIVKGKVNFGFLPENGNADSGSPNGDSNQVIEGRGSNSSDIATDLPNSVSSSDQASPEKEAEKSPEEKLDSTEKVQKTELDIEKEIDSLSVPTVFSSSPVIPPRSSRQSNIKMLKVIPQLASKRQQRNNTTENTNSGSTSNSRNETADDSSV